MGIKYEIADGYQKNRNRKQKWTRGKFLIGERDGQSNKPFWISKIDSSECNVGKREELSAKYKEKLVSYALDTTYTLGYILRCLRRVSPQNHGCWRVVSCWEGTPVPGYVTRRWEKPFGLSWRIIYVWGYIKNALIFSTETLLDIGTLVLYYISYQPQLARIFMSTIMWT